MKQSDARAEGCGYFAITRLVGRAAGRKSTRSEGNTVESYSASLLFYLLTVVCLRNLIGGGFAATAIVLVATWFCWLFLLYVNSLLVRLARVLGAFRKLSNSKAQSIIIGGEMALIALSLAAGQGWIRWVGISWLILTVINLAAAAVLLMCNQAWRMPE